MSLKKATYALASATSLPLKNNRGEIIGKLVPIGVWALQDEQLVDSFFQWRKMFMRFFLAQFPPSHQSTLFYLRTFSIEKQDRLLFAIYVDDDLFGHIGLSNITNRDAELDNVVRGVAGGPDDLMYHAEKTILHWAFMDLGIATVTAQVLSRNFLALELHKRLNFTVSKVLPLKKREDGALLSYIPCDESEATETFSLAIIELDKANFDAEISPEFEPTAG